MSITTPLTDMELVHGIREGDERMREQLIMRHTPLVRSIARRYVGRGLALDDIVQAGNLGLVQSVKSLPAGAGCAAERVCGPNHRGRDHASVPRPRLGGASAAVVAGAEPAHVGHARADVAQARSRPSTNELAEALEVTPDQVEEAVMAQRAYTADSLDVGTSDDGTVTGSRAQWLATDDQSMESVPDRATLVDGCCSRYRSVSAGSWRCAN